MSLNSRGQRAYRVCFAVETIRVLLVRNETVVKLIRSEFLQTEVRVLYELQYILNHTFRANKTFKALKQVSHCGVGHTLVSRSSTCDHSC